MRLNMTMRAPQAGQPIVAAKHRLGNNVGTGLAALGLAALLGLIGVSPVRAQDTSGTVPPQVTGAAPGGPGSTAGPGAPSGLPPVQMLLGYGFFMLTLERPWQAEKFYKLILMQDPNNAAARKGLHDAKNMERIGFTFLGHSYYDSKDVQLIGYGGGPVIRTPTGKITITAGNGYYKNNNNKNNKRNPLSLIPTTPDAEDNFPLQKQTYNVLFEPFWGAKMQHEGSAWLSWQAYDNVPDRLLYDFRYSYIPQPGRKKFTLGTGRKDSFYQNQVNQFLAPETYYMLKKKILFSDYYTGVEYPLGQKWDFTFNYRYFKYTDQNERNNFRTQILYRIMPKDPAIPIPVWRVGLDGIVDEGRFFTFDYGIPQDFRSLSIATDFAVLTPDFKGVLYLSYPIAEKNFAAPAGVVAYLAKTVGGDRRFEVYGKAIILEARNLSVSLYDYVLGLNTRF